MPLKGDAARKSLFAVFAESLRTREGPGAPGPIEKQKERDRVGLLVGRRKSHHPTGVVFAAAFSA